MKKKNATAAIAKLSDRILGKAQIEMDVPFHDVDGWNRVWHGNYFKYFEAARTVLLKKKGLDIPECETRGYIWPVIDCGCRYISPVRYAMRIEVTAVMEEIEHRLKIGYLLSDKSTGKRMAKGFTVQVAVDQKTGEMCLATPEEFLKLFRSK